MPDPSPSRIFTAGRLIDRSAHEPVQVVTRVDPTSHPALFAVFQTLEPIGPVTTATALDAAAALRTGPAN
jgi:hypothetical protein